MAKAITQKEMTELEQNDKLCPFATGYYGGGTFWFVHNCLGNNCAIWNEEKKQCSLKRP